MRRPLQSAAPRGAACLSTCVHGGRAPRRARRILALALAAVALALALVAAPSPAAAIPAFARRYETSCQTCHLVFPKLSPFGEAFRRNGYRFPSRGDAAAEKEEPLPLGNEALKDVWPRAVYPGQIPGKVPLSVTFDARAVLGTKLEPHNAGVEATTAGDAHAGHGAAAPTGALRSDFGQLGGSARLLAGGTFGEVADFFVAISIGGHAPIEVERVALTFTPTDPATLRIRLGRFEPELHGISIHRGVFGHMLRFTTMGIGLNAVAPEPYLNGIQLSGVVAGRAGWAAGVGQSSAPVDGLEKDFYGRVEGKIGGMRLDGVGSTAGSMPWREYSLTLGASGYRGRAKVTTPTAATHDDRFLRVGIDAHAVVHDLLVDVAVARQRNDAPGEKDFDPRNLDLAYAEITYVTWAWLFPSVRFEGSRITGQTPLDTSSKWIGALGVNCLVRANLGLRAELATGTDPGEAFGFRFAALNASAAF